MVGNILYFLLFLFAVLLTAIMPFPLLYQFSNFMAFVFRKVLRYRLMVVHRNLLRSFPEKSKEEILNIEKEFYKNLTDVSLETLKGFTVTRRQLNKRYKVINPEILDKYYEKGTSVIGLTGHLNNWEWGALVAGLQLKHKPVAFYKQIQNPYINQLIRRSREKKGTSMISIAETEKYFEETMDQTCLYILVADQSPSNVTKAFWVNFLNQDTPCLHGPEKYAHLYNYPLIFIDIKRIKRGYYTVKASLLSENPRMLKSGEVTQLYMEKLEDSIKNNPPGWLWSHRRWKKKRPTFMASPPRVEHNPL